MIYDTKTLQFIYKRMLDTVKILSLDAEKQIEVLKGCVVSDEIALSFHDDAGIWCTVLIDNELINEEEYKKIVEIDGKFDEMSDNKDLWTDEQLRISNVWQECRRLGRELLESLENMHSK